MAADTRVTGDGAIYHADKIFRIGDSLLGTAGDAFMCRVFLEWFKNPKRSVPALRKMLEREEKDAFLILELEPKGLALWNGWGIPEPIHDQCYGIGSGSMSALALLRKGASLEDAVNGAMPLDEATGGRVQIEYLLPPELRPKRRK